MYTSKVAKMSSIINNTKGIVVYASICLQNINTVEIYIDIYKTLSL